MGEKLIPSSTPGYLYNSEIIEAVHLSDFNKHYSSIFSSFDHS